jgi:flagellar motor switch protein FliM
MTATQATPANPMAFILERLVGDTGEPDRVVDAARSLGERAVPAILDRLGEAFPGTFSVELKTVEVARFAEARPEDPTSHAMTVASSTSSPDAMLFLLDGAAIAVMVSSLFGGDLDMAVAPIARELSPTEIDVASTVFQLVAEVLNGSGSRAFDLKLPLAPPVTGIDLKKQVIRDGPAVRVDFAVFTPGGRGVLSVFFPQRVLLKHRGDAVANSGDKGNEWRSRFNDEVMRSSVALEAKMPLGKLTLGDVAGLRKGQVLELDAGASKGAVLSSRGKTLFVCEFGKLGQNYTVRVDRAYDAGQEFIDGLLPV